MGRKFKSLSCGFSKMWLLLFSTSWILKRGTITCGCCIRWFSSESPRWDLSPVLDAPIRLLRKAFLSMKSDDFSSFFLVVTQSSHQFSRGLYSKIIFIYSPRIVCLFSYSNINAVFLTISVPFFLLSSQHTAQTVVIDCIDIKKVKRDFLCFCFFFFWNSQTLESQFTAAAKAFQWKQFFIVYVSN